MGDVIDVGAYALVLDVRASDVPAWLLPVVEGGRDAAFVDTGYIRALLDERDARHGVVRQFHEGLSASLYTSALVVAEAARQLAKAGRVDQAWRWDRVDALASIFVHQRRITICAPPDDVVAAGLRRLSEMQRVITGLDLCDLMSMVVLDMLNHRRVLGFDNHFRTIGASLEP